LKTYIIIPAYNEYTKLSEVLESVLTLGYPVILVNDGSTDNTLSLAARFPVLLITHAWNLGQGAALETGMEAARRLDADFVVHFDADGQHDPADIETVLSPLQSGKSDIVFGSRFLEIKSSGLSAFRKYLLKTARWFNYMTTGILLTDAHNGMRALNKKALHAIHFHQPGMAHASEILFEVRKKSLRWLEVPVHIRYTAYSKRKGQTLFNSINILFHILYKKIK
jgi:glycosyltransferase involved in cell wall biosynthesis